ncbi:hypothetical protein M422DRAFT_271641 [Sphaerobolus stellatus SS14]|uniref:Uncharacterized protein n=1 Tax=Sphaerobolus stellatus (strain SS14) TaxID=990650 RepID=A0A0C9TDA1_SPHS4|nr:hypothetical protein M422DRAFT_271641 [Sphaerobolus stellatus SS14]
MSSTTSHSSSFFTQLLLALPDSPSSSAFVAPPTHASETILMTFTATLALLVTLVVWVIDIVLWGIARSRFRNVAAFAQYGNANWLTFGALIALILAFCVGAIGSCGNYRHLNAEELRGFFNSK